MIGCDLIEVNRVKKLVEKENINNVFTEQEQIYCEKYKDKYQHYAGFFCAKEAFVKAVGSGLLNGIKLCDLEISHNAFGKPILSVLSDDVLNKFNLIGKNIEISISHINDFAMAICQIL